MTTTFAGLLPEVLGPIELALRGEGYTAQAEALANSKVERWTYDHSAKAGYVYLVQHTPLHSGEAPASKTLAFSLPRGFNIDLRMNGEIFGIEFLEHASAFTRLAKTKKS